MYRAAQLLRMRKNQSVAVVESSGRKRRDVLGATLRRLRSDPSHPFPIVKH